jgi:hypothetical protein
MYADMDSKHPPPSRTTFHDTMRGMFSTDGVMRLRFDLRRRSIQPLPLELPLVLLSLHQDSIIKNQPPSHQSQKKKGNATATQLA